MFNFHIVEVRTYIYKPDPRWWVQRAFFENGDQYYHSRMRIPHQQNRGRKQ